MPIREEAINVFMGLPGDGDRLELTYNHGVDSYELGTGYNHIALTVDDINGTLERLGGAGHRAREAAVPGARGRVVDRLRPRSRRLPDRADREEQGLDALRVSTRCHRLRVELVPPRRLHLHGHVVEAHGRDPRGRARGRRSGGLRRAAAGADGAGAGDARALRALLRGDGDRRDPARRHLGDPRRVQPGRVPGRGARALRARDRGPARARRGALRLPGGGELDDAVRRRRAGPGRRLDAAHARGASGWRWTRARGRWAPCA